MSVYSDAVLADSPSRYWQLNETSGTTAADSSGNSRPGTYSGGYTQGQQGRAGSNGGLAVLLNGSTGFVYANGSVAEGQTSFTIECWVKTTGTSVILIGLSDQQTAASSGNHDRMLYVDTTGHATLYVWDGSAVVTTGSVINDGKWHHVVGQYDQPNASFRVYVDGSQVGLNSGWGNGSMVSYAAGYWRVGRPDSGSTPQAVGFLSGTIQQVAIWDTVPITAARVTAHYNAGHNGYFFLGALESPTAALVKQPGRVLGALESAAAALARNAARGQAAGVTPSSSMTQGISRQISPGQGTTGALGRGVSNSLGATEVLNGTLTRSVARSLLASVITAAALVRGVSRAYSATLGTLGAVTRSVLRLLGAQVAVSGSVRQGVTLTFSATAGSGAGLRRAVARRIAAGLGAVASLLGRIFRPDAAVPAELVYFTVRSCTGVVTAPMASGIVNLVHPTGQCVVTTRYKG